MKSCACTCWRSCVCACGCGHACVHVCAHVGLTPQPHMLSKRINAFIVLIVMLLKSLCSKATVTNDLTLRFNCNTMKVNCTNDRLYIETLKGQL